MTRVVGECRALSATARKQPKRMFMLVGYHGMYVIGSQLWSGLVGSLFFPFSSLAPIPGQSEVACKQNLVCLEIQPTKRELCSSRERDEGEGGKLCSLGLFACIV